MRLVDGIDLARLLRRLGALDPPRTLRIVEQLAGALDAAHARGLVHRDVKPANVLLTAEEPEHVYLTDFGVAKSVGSAGALTQRGEWVGTLDYLAPEQLQGGELSAAVDIYALTGLLYHCLTGETPYPRDNDAARLLAHLNDPPPRPSQRAPGRPPPDFDEVIARGLAKDPADRYPSAGELARAAARALGLAVELSAPAAHSPVRPESIQPDAPTVVPE
jgi:serine/threonine protein kinase